MGIDVAAPLPEDYAKVLSLLRLSPLAGGEKSQ
jgi:hypothetical protein